MSDAGGFRLVFVDDAQAERFAKELRGMARDWRRAAEDDKRPTGHARKMGRAEGLTVAADLLAERWSPKEGGT